MHPSQVTLFILSFFLALVWASGNGKFRKPRTYKGFSIKIRPINADDTAKDKSLEEYKPLQSSPSKKEHGQNTVVKVITGVTKGLIKGVAYGGFIFVVVGGIIYVVAPESMPGQWICELSTTCYSWVIDNATSVWSYFRGYFWREISSKAVEKVWTFTDGNKSYSYMMCANLIHLALLGKLDASRWPYAQDCAKALVGALKAPVSLYIPK